MLVDLTEEEINFLKTKFDYSNKENIPFLEMKIFDKVSLAEDTREMTVSDAIEKLYNLYLADCGVSEYAKEFLICLKTSYLTSLSNLSNFDSSNFKAAKFLFDTLGSDERFEMWDQIAELKF
jgi:hypothetical protein